MVELGEMTIMNWCAKVIQAPWIRRRLNKSRTEGLSKKELDAQIEELRRLRDERYGAD